MDLDSNGDTNCNFNLFPRYFEFYIINIWILGRISPKKVFHYVFTFSCSYTFIGL
jgi:hypothetical protein